MEILEDKYTDAIKSEISKGRTFDQILNETPSDDCSTDELYAWVDAGEIAGFSQNNDFFITKIKVYALTVLLIIFTFGLVVSPFLVANKILLLLNIPLGIIIAILGRKNSELYSTIEMKMGLIELNKHLFVKGYATKSKIKEYLFLIFTPLDWVCQLCELLFPRITPIIIKKDEDK
ncbi:MAG: hypothetical protein QNK75_05215 [Crocinitomicaceae bacterium]|jgi:hypothetical protein